MARLGDGLPTEVRKLRRSKRGQELWALAMLKEKYGEFKYNGFFIELGAHDGVMASDTFMLEKGLDWDGVCIEPSNMYEQLVENRSCTCLHELVGEDGVAYPFVATGRRSSVVVGIEDVNQRAFRRRGGAVSTIAKSLTTILDEIRAPSVIDYFSLDVEGFEFTVLENVDFDKYQFSTMTVERRATADKVVAFLAERGYEHVKTFKDDNGFIHESLKHEDNGSVV